MRDYSSTGFQIMNGLNEPAHDLSKNPVGIMFAPVWVPLLVCADAIGYPIAFFMHGLHHAGHFIRHREFLDCDETAPALTKDTAAINKALLNSNKENVQKVEDKIANKKVQFDLSNQSTNAPSFLKSESILNPKSKPIITENAAPISVRKLSK